MTADSIAVRTRGKMRERQDFPHPIDEIENCWVPLSDGCQLAARIWLPAGALASPVPAILEYIPYRKRDATRWRDEPMHRYFAGHGYAALRVDLRGSGDSDGLLLDEYHPQEQADALEVLRWIAGQPWCSGKVGMIGKSWGGFSALQVAALDPPELAAVIAVCATDDRYADDAHYMGGCLLNENLVWGSMLFTITAQPPDPAIPRPGASEPCRPAVALDPIELDFVAVPGLVELEPVGAVRAAEELAPPLPSDSTAWRRIWLDRLENTVLYPEIWLSHPERDDYWRHGSICQDYAAIRCPVYAVSGWADGYTNAVPRLLSALGVPCKGLIGPWGHSYPHNGAPGPAIGFLQESLRWWDRWLKNVDTGIMEEPPYRVWMQNSLDGKTARAVAAHEVDQPGRWVAEASWPSPRIAHRRFCLHPRPAAEVSCGIVGSGSLEEQPPSPGTVSFRTVPSVGAHAAAWCSFGIEGELPADTLEDDRRSLSFQTPPLAEPLELLGSPTVQVALAAPAGAGQLVARLVAVAPDGTGTRISLGMIRFDLSGTSRSGTAGDVTPRFAIALKHLGQSVPAGYSLRLCLSTSYWPMVWPAVRNGSLELQVDQCHLELPLRAPDPRDAGLRPFPEPEAAPRGSMVDVHPGGLVRTHTHDPATTEHLHRTELDLDDDGEPSRTLLEDIGLELGHSITEEFRIRDDDPFSARATVRQNVCLRRDGWRAEILTEMMQRASASEFLLEATLEAREDGQVVFQREWQRRIARRDRPRAC